MKSFNLLPADVRRAVARRELRRRGLHYAPEEQGDWRKVLPFLSNANLENAEELRKREENGLSPESREQWAAIFSDTLRAMRQAGAPNSELAAAARLVECAGLAGRAAAVVPMSTSA